MEVTGKVFSICHKYDVSFSQSVVEKKLSSGQDSDLILIPVIKIYEILKKLKKKVVEFGQRPSLFEMLWSIHTEGAYTSSPPISALSRHGYKEEERKKSAKKFCQENLWKKHRTIWYFYKLASQER